MPDKNGNENCLEGYECPKCGNHEAFKVHVLTAIEMFDDGTGEHDDTEWDDDSHMTCVPCGHGAQAKEFELPDEDTKELVAFVDELMGVDRSAYQARTQGDYSI